MQWLIDVHYAALDYVKVLSDLFISNPTDQRGQLAGCKVTDQIITGFQKWNFMLHGQKYYFLMRDAMLARYMLWPCVCLSVHLSVWQGFF